jgi:hypothetical protein
MGGNRVNDADSIETSRNEGDFAAVERLKASFARLKGITANDVDGQNAILQQLSAGIFAREDALLIGVPGRANALMIHSNADALNRNYDRIGSIPESMLPAPVSKLGVGQGPEHLGSRLGSEVPDNRSRPSAPRSADRERNPRGQVSIFYSHRDSRHLDDLLTHLRPCMKNTSVEPWSDKQIEPGSRWFEENRSALSKTSVAVLLVSPDFLYSEFIQKHEFGPILKKAEAGGVKILWVLVRDCVYNETPLKDYQAVVSPPDRPFARMRPAERDTAWRKFSETVKQVANQFQPAISPGFLAGRVDWRRENVTAANPWRDAG